MKPDDIVMYRDGQFGKHRFWEIKSVCLGADGQESLIELKSLTDKAGLDTKGEPHDTTWVPEPLLRSYVVFTPIRE